MTQLAVSHLRLATPRRGDSATPASDKDKGGVMAHSESRGQKTGQNATATEAAE
jgi:hypothetical protein